VKYKFVESNNELEFEKRINEALAEGWNLYGTLACTSHHQPEICPPMFTTYCQGMIKEEHEKGAGS